VDLNYIKKETMKKKRAVISLKTQILAATAMLLLSPNLIAFQHPYNDSLNQAAAQTSINPPSVNTSPISFPELFSKVQTSVVQISDIVTTVDGEGTRLGSGFVYDMDGHIITNYHVVQSNSRNSQFDVTFSDGEAYTAKLVGFDPYSDLAVLSLIDAPTGKLVPLPVGKSSGIRVGDTVIAIGNPFGLAGSMTAGIVSGLGRVLPSDNSDHILNSNPLSFSIPNIIQTDAAINPGNSGGPLLNSNGEVIGINTAIYSSTGVYSGVGFAIPSDTLTKIIPSLIRSGLYQHPYLGIVGLNVTPSLQEQLGLKEKRGFLITSITPGGPADKYGLRAATQVNSDTGEATVVGDVILKIDNQVVKKTDDVLSYLEESKSVGDSVHLAVDRGGVITELDIVLDARPSPSDIQNIAAGQQELDLRPQFPNNDNDGANRGSADNPINECARFAGADLCGFFFGR
jgi:S1-C subfamily serine protease